MESYAETPEVVPIELKTTAGDTMCNLIGFVAAWLIFYWFLSRNQTIERAESGERGRDASIDLVRTTAAFLVVFVHSFLASGYYNAALANSGMTVLTFFRWIALSCVPLFMLTTGYLCVYKLDIRSTYLGSLPNFILFALVSIIRVVVWEGMYIKAPITLESFLGELIGMKSAWYMKMYAGLLLLMPFINRIWYHLKKSEKQVLLSVLLLITMGQSVLGSIFPNYWVALYPLTYYFAGAYLREQTIPLAQGKLFILYLGVICLETVLSHTSPSPSGTFDWGLLGGFECNYNAVPVFLSTLLLFSILRTVKIKCVILKNFLKVAGTNTLGIYLVSGLIDNIVYPPLQRKYLTPQKFAVVQVPAALTSFLISLLLSVLLTASIQTVINHFEKRRQEQCQFKY